MDTCSPTTGFTHSFGTFGSLILWWRPAALGDSLLFKTCQRIGRHVSCSPRDDFLISFRLYCVAINGRSLPTTVNPTLSFHAISAKVSRIFSTERRGPAPESRSPGVRFESHLYRASGRTVLASARTSLTKTALPSLTLRSYEASLNSMRSEPERGDTVPRQRVGAGTRQPCFTRSRMSRSASRRRSGSSARTRKLASYPGSSRPRRRLGKMA